jgi:tetratricopeptide (TPR) repeat protein/TolB-like protein
VLTAADRQRAKELITEALAHPAADRASFLADIVADRSTREELSAIICSCDPEATTAARAPVALQRVGPYVFTRTLGQGGMGRVYLAHDTRLSRRVAIKALSSRPGAHDLVARVMSEASAAAQINDPRIAAVYDVLEVEGTAYIVMEYVPGPTLSQYARHRSLPPNEVARLGVQIADALVRAHRAGVVHCDLKPSNIKITDEGGVKILDFGLARQTVDRHDGEPPATMTGAIGGTPGYMSPEQILVRPLDARTDVYSLGVILFELASGARPFRGSDVVSAALAALTDPAPALPDSVPAPLRDVITRSLAKDRAERMQSAADVRDALRPLVDPPMRSVPHLRRPTVAAAAVGAFIAAVAAVLFSSRAAPPARRTKPVVAILPFTSADGRTKTPLATGVADILASDLADVPGLVLVARSASLLYSADPSTFSQVADALGADDAITGTIDDQAGALHASIAFRDLRTRAMVWQKDFNAPAGDVIALERAIADESIARLGGGTPAFGRAGHTARLTTDRLALEEYSQGRTFLDRPDDTATIDRALKLFESALARDPRFALAYAAVGEACAAQYGLTHDRAWADRARDAMLEALSLDPKQPMVRYALAAVHRVAGRPQEAIEQLRAAIELQPSNDEFHLLLGRIYVDLNRTDEAVAEFKLAMALRPGFWDTYRALGLAYYNAGRYADAIEAFKRATELQPDSNSGFQMLGTAYHAAGDVVHALESYERANAIKPSANAWANVGMLRYSQHRYADAVAAYEQSIALRPRDAISFRNLGDSYARLPDTDASRNAYKRAIDLVREQLTVNPNSAELIALEAVCLAKLGRHAEAQALAARASTLAPRSGSVLYKKGVVLALADRTSEALAVLKIAFDFGASRDLARDDDDLAALRSLPAFATAVDKRSR